MVRLPLDQIIEECVVRLLEDHTRKNIVCSIKERLVHEFVEALVPDDNGSFDRWEALVK